MRHGAEAVRHIKSYSAVVAVESVKLESSGAQLSRVIEQQRPNPPPLPQYVEAISVRLPAPMTKALDIFIEELRADMPLLPISRTDAARHGRRQVRSMAGQVPTRGITSANAGYLNVH